MKAGLAISAPRPGFPGMAEVCTKVPFYYLSTERYPHKGSPQTSALLKALIFCLLSPTLFLNTGCCSASVAVKAITLCLSPFSFHWERFFDQFVVLQLPLLAGTDINDTLIERDLLTLLSLSFVHLESTWRLRR